MEIDVDEMFIRKMISDKFDDLDDRQPDIVDSFTDDIMHRINFDNFSLEALVRANIAGKVERKVKAMSKHIPEDNDTQSELVGMDGEKWLESGKYYNKEFVKNRHSTSRDNRTHMQRVDDHFESVTKARHTEGKRFIKQVELFEKYPTAKNNGEAIEMEAEANIVDDVVHK